MRHSVHISNEEGTGVVRLLGLDADTGGLSANPDTKNEYLALTSYGAC